MTIDEQIIKNMQIETELKNAEKNKKVLKEIIDLYREWLGYRKSDFEFFTLLNEIVCKNEMHELKEENTYLRKELDFYKATIKRLRELLKTTRQKLKENS